MTTTTTPLSTETTCCMSKMPLAKKCCSNRLSVLAHDGMCAERAKNALLRSKTLGSRRIEAIALEATRVWIQTCPSSMSHLSDGGQEPRHAIPGLARTGVMLRAGALGRAPALPLVWWMSATAMEAT